MKEKVKNKVAFAGYAPRSWAPSINDSFKQSNIDIYWICASKSVITFMRENGVESKYLIDASDRTSRTKEHDKEYLYDLEMKTGYRINDIIVKDRMLIKLDYYDALGYLYGACQKIEEILIEKEIELVIGLADTALQLITIAICRKLNIKWRLFVGMRIPRRYYGYSKSELSCDLCEINAEGNQQLAEKVIEEYRAQKTSPVFWLSSLNITAILNKIPTHASILLRKIKESKDDTENVYSRYSPAQLIIKYVKRKINGLAYLILIKRDASTQGEYYLYALQTQPESSLDVMGAPYNNQIDIIRHIARAIDVKKTLYVKAHPGDIDGKNFSYYREIQKIPGVKLIDHSLSTRKLLQNCQCLFTISGTIGYEAAILGKPAVTFGKNYYNIFPTIKYCSDLTEISVKLNEAINQSNYDNEELINTAMKNLTKVFYFDADFVPELNQITGADGLPNSHDLNVMVNSIRYFLRE